MQDTAALLAVTRFGLGPRPGEVAALADDPRAALTAMLGRPEAALVRDPPHPDPYGALRACMDWKRQRKVAKRAGAEVVPGMEGAAMAGPDVMAASAEAGMQDAAGMAAPPGADMKGAAMRGRDGAGENCFGEALQAEIAARVAHAVETETPFLERLVMFWSNHFAVSADKNAQVRLLAGDFERSAIRPHVAGRFLDMLHAVVAHPAMLLYLDNDRSVGPNSRMGKKRGKGLNENLAREILELHTLGVDGGYTQADVTSFARILTGWTTTGRKDEERPFSFRFEARLHEPGTISMLGRAFADEGQAQGVAVLDMLAAHPATARHVARSMVRHFVAEDPPPALVDRLEDVFQRTDGDLAELASALVNSDEAWSGARVKLLPPYDFVVSALRATGVAPKPRLLRRSFVQLGQPVWMPPSPEGWPDEDGAWMLPDALVERVDWAADLVRRVPPTVHPSELAEAVLGPALDSDTRQTIARAESREQGLTLLLLSSQLQRR